MARPAVEKELMGLERQYWQAIKEKDVETASRLTDETCVVAGPQGVGTIDRKDLEGMMESGEWSLKAFKLEEIPQVRLLGDDVAVVAYNIHEDMTVDGKPVSLEAADSSVWVRRNGSWLCAAHTESISADPYGRARRA